MKCIINWAVKQVRRKTKLGRMLSLCYFILANVYFQGAIHLFASCVLGAFAYKGQDVNWHFLIPFVLIYLLFIFLFSACNIHRKSRNNLLRQYEYAYPKITEFLLTEYREELELYKTGINLSFDDFWQKYKNFNLLDESCLRKVCEAVNYIMRQESGSKYRVAIFLRTNIDQTDQYAMKVCSPIAPPPEAENKTFKLADFKGLQKKKIPAHARPFLNQRCEPIILIGEKEIRKAYQDFHEAHPTKLHIGIPIAVNGMVVMALQITSHDEYKGTENNIRDLIDNVLSIFVAYLTMAYMHQLRHEQLIKIKGEC